MLFNSIDFAFFLPIVFILYWFVFKNNLKLQNGLIVVASYVFYGWWNWKFLLLILLSSIIDYTIGVALKHQEHEKKRKHLLWLSITSNLGILLFFKYFNFFIENFTNAFSLLGYTIPTTSLNIILPVGISFYTFQTMSYTIDVYKKKLEPTTDFIAFSAFVSFFPQLVAGPIERATHLLPQFYTKRKFEYDKAVDGMRQILWGLFKKIVIADNCAELANQVFNHSDQYSGLTLLLGAILFTFQIYGDFSGYSDIAIGTSRLFGFDLMQNFATPYFSRDIAEFWRRWHISLSTWFRDYVYIPLGGSQGGLIMKIRNTFIIFLVSGFWHGANWTFIAWGGLNALYFLPLLLANRNRNNIGVVAENTFLPSLKELFQMTTTFLLTVLAWIFFRAENILHAKEYLISMIKGMTISKYYFESIVFFKESIGFEFTLILIVFFLFEWIGRKGLFALSSFNKLKSKYLRWSFYFLIFGMIFWFSGEEQEFIYFQF
jgi:alginate O-acetyltransferase complex protein AlgI